MPNGNVRLENDFQPFGISFFFCSISRTSLNLAHYFFEWPVLVLFLRHTVSSLSLYLATRGNGQIGSANSQLPESALRLSAVFQFASLMVQYHRDCWSRMERSPS